jgi:hypothetical protein
MKTLKVAAAVAALFSALPAAAQEVVFPVREVDNLCKKVSSPYEGTSLFARETEKCLTQVQLSYDAARAGWSYLLPEEKGQCVSIADRSAEVWPIGFYSVLGQCVSWKIERALASGRLERKFQY